MHGLRTRVWKNLTPRRLNSFLIQEKLLFYKREGVFALKKLADSFWGRFCFSHRAAF
jgi:hypothetical protein